MKSNNNSTFDRYLSCLMVHRFSLFLHWHGFIS